MQPIIGLISCVGKKTEIRLNSMYKKNKSEVQTTWSEKMLEFFIDSYLSRFSGLGGIPYLIMGKISNINISIKEGKYESIGYIGILPRKELWDVYFSFAVDNAGSPPSEEHEDCIGYLELINGIAEDFETPVPMIRGFIKRGLGFFETINGLLRDAKIFGWEHPIGFSIRIVNSSGKSINTGNILGTEFGIKKVEFYQNLNVFERDELKIF